jgi:hypothetical protein
LRDHKALIPRCGAFTDPRKHHKVLAETIIALCLSIRATYEALKKQNLYYCACNLAPQPNIPTIPRLAKTPRLDRGVNYRGAKPSNEVFFDFFTDLLLAL